MNLINAAVKHEVKCFVFTSSIAVYGAGQLPMSEDMAPAPGGPVRHRQVRGGAWTSTRPHEMFGLHYIIFRPHNVYGERQNIGDRYRNVIGIFMNQIMQGQPMTIFGDGDQTRAFSYIGDVAPDHRPAPQCRTPTARSSTSAPTRPYYRESSSPPEVAARDGQHPAKVNHLPPTQRSRARLRAARQSQAGVRLSGGDGAGRGLEARRRGRRASEPARTRRSTGRNRTRAARERTRAARLTPRRKPKVAEIGL